MSVILDYKSFACLKDKWIIFSNIFLFPTASQNNFILVPELNDFFLPNLIKIKLAFFPNIISWETISSFLWISSDHWIDDVKKDIISLYKSKVIRHDFFTVHSLVTQAHGIVSLSWMNSWKVLKRVMCSVCAVFLVTPEFIQSSLSLKHFCEQKPIPLKCL